MKLLAWTRYKAKRPQTHFAFIHFVPYLSCRVTLKAKFQISFTNTSWFLFYYCKE